MKTLLLMLLGMLSLHAVAETVQAVVPTPPAVTAQQAPTEGPVEQRRRLIDALVHSDAVAYIDAVGGEEALKGFLGDGGGAEAEVATRQRIAEKAARGETDEFSREWARLAAADGVEQALAVWYPQWQQQVPQTLAMIQLGMVSMGTAIAESKELTPLQRSQFTELQWAVTGWLSRTDFVDAKRFEKVVREARNLVLATGVDDPELLEFTTPQQRIALVSKGMESFKNVADLYGIDVRAILRSVRTEELERNADKARIRTSATVLGVDISFDEDLAWWDGRWRDPSEAEMYRSMAESAAADDEAAAEAPAVDAEAAAAADVGWPAEPVLAEPAPEPEKTNIGEIGGCHGPD